MFVVTLTTVVYIIILFLYCSKSGVHVDNGNIEIDNGKKSNLQHN